jgi:glycosyltransferase involved in cell wall biosynthesis
MSTRPKVSVILPCRNERRHIEACLRDIFAQELLPGDFEVLVADGLSDDGTREILSQATARNQVLRIIDNPGRIISVGLNAALREAKGEIVIRMDAHTVYAPDYVVRCVETLERTGADNIGGPARTKADSYMQKAVAAAYHSPFSVGGARFHDVNYEGYVDTVTYGCWRKEAFDRFGCFDEEFCCNEDDEYNLRIVRGGGKIWQSPKIRSWYHPRASLPTLFRQYLQYGYWKVRVIQKHKRPASIRHLVPGGFVAALCSLAVAGLIWHPAWWAAGALLVAYLFANFAASVHCAVKNKLALLPVLPAVFAAYHFGYGIGFLCGIWDFGIRHKRPSAVFTSLTRG